jgi:hypothetical protein
LKDGEPHGQGTTTYPSDRVFYSGEWVDGSPTDKKLESFVVADRPIIDWRSMAEPDESKLKAINCFFEGNVFVVMHLIYMTMIVIEASAGHNWSNMTSYPLIGIWNIASVSRSRIRNIRV